MTEPEPQAPPNRRWLNPWRIMSIPITVATLGAAIPYGESDPLTRFLTPLEWIITGAFVIALGFLIAGLVHPRPKLMGWSMLIAGFVWTTYSVYLYIVRDHTWLDSIGTGTTALGWAIAGLLGWRAIEVVRKRGLSND